MEYIVPSIGRCGSKVVCRLISAATGRKARPAYTFDDLAVETGDVRHTHVHLQRALPYEYRAVFVTGRIGDTIASMYHERPRLRKHLRAMNVDGEAQALFWDILAGGASRLAAFAFLIDGDRFGFKANIASWKASPYTLVVRYEELCGDKKRHVLAGMSEHLGVRLGDFNVRFRYSAASQLPLALQVMIREEYGDAA